MESTIILSFDGFYVLVCVIKNKWVWCQCFIRELYALCMLSLKSVSLSLSWKCPWQCQMEIGFLISEYISGNSAKNLGSCSFSLSKSIRQSVISFSSKLSAVCFKILQNTAVVNYNSTLLVWVWSVGFLQLLEVKHGLLEVYLGTLPARSAHQIQ